MFISTNPLIRIPLKTFCDTKSVTEAHADINVPKKYELGTIYEYTSRFGCVLDPTLNRRLERGDWFILTKKSKTQQGIEYGILLLKNGVMSSVYRHTLDMCLFDPVVYYDE